MTTCPHCRHEHRPEDVTIVGSYFRMGAGPIYQARGLPVLHPSATAAEAALCERRAKEAR